MPSQVVAVRGCPRPNMNALMLVTANASHLKWAGLFRSGMCAGSNPADYLFESSRAYHAFKKLFTYSAVENVPEPRYSFSRTPTDTVGPTETPGRILMTTQGTKPTAGKSSATTRRPAAKSVALPPVAVPQVSQVAKPIIRPAPKAAAPAPRQGASPLAAPKRSTPWTVEAASRVQRTIAVKNGGTVGKGSLAAVAMSKATKGAPPHKSRAK